jgi:hypothetical protein
MKAKLITSIKPGKKLNRSGYFELSYHTKGRMNTYYKTWICPIDLKQ